MFFRVLSKIFSLYLFRLGEAVLVGVFKKVLFPQRVASEKVRNVRVPRNYFSLHLFPVGEAILGGVLKKSFVPSKGRQRETRFFTSVLNIPSLIPTGRGRLGSHSQKIFYPQRVGSESDRKLRLGRNFYFPSRLFPLREVKSYACIAIFIPQGVDHEKNRKLSLLKKIFFFPQ